MRLQQLVPALSLIYVSLVCAEPLKQFRLSSLASDSFNWTTVAQSSQLRWTKCYEQHECTRLQVPLDWQNPDDGRHASLAVIRLPSAVSRTDPSFGGSILVNPGGPGVSGVDFLRWGGLEMRSKIDNKKHFEFVSWDPRGVGHTLPSASCFDSDLQRQAFAFKLAAIGNPGDSDASLKVWLAGAEAFAEACDSNKYLKYMSTLFNVHDMVALIDSLDPQTKKPLLKYWGFSYGTYLGNTFASVYPERIDRMVLDGVIDAVDYTKAIGLTTLNNIDDVLQFFYTACWQAGDVCPLSEENLANLKLKVEAFLSKLWYEPMPSFHWGRADIIQYSDVITLMRESMYYPMETFPLLARILKDLMEGDTTSMATQLTRIRDPQSEDPEVILKPTNRSWDNPQLPGYPWEAEVTRAVICGDGDDISNRTFAEQRQFVNKLKSQSKYFGSQWAQLTTWCARYSKSLRPATMARFTGPFGSNLSDYNSKAAPILFIGNLADPATPINNAYKMSNSHEGSIVLKTLQHSHVTGPISPNECVYSHVSEYFDSGRLPRLGQICPADRMPWQ